MRHVATNVREEVVAGSGHWLIEEKPGYTVALIRRFLDGSTTAPAIGGSAAVDSNEERLPPPSTGFRNPVILVLEALALRASRRSY